MRVRGRRKRGAGGGRRGGGRTFFLVGWLVGWLMEGSGSSSSRGSVLDIYTS